MSTAPTIYPLMRFRDAPGLGWIYVAVEDPDGHCRRARAAGAEILAEPYDTDYGSRDYTARDPEGNQWHFGTHRPSPRAEP